MKAVFIETNVIQLASIFVEAMHPFRSALYYPARDSYLCPFKEATQIIGYICPYAVSTVKFIKSVRCFEHKFVLFSLYLI